MRVKDILIGQVPEGKTGYAHLCKIKERYYSEPDVKEVTEAEDEVLCEFFSRYFEINGFIKESVVPAEEREKLIFLKRDRIFQSFTTTIKGLPVKVSLKDFDYEDYFKDRGLTLVFGGFHNQMAIFYLDYRDKKYLKYSLEDLKECAERRRIRELYGIEVDVTEEDLLKLLDEFKKRPEVDYFLYENIGEFLRKEYLRYFEGNQKVLHLIDKIGWFEKELVRLHQEFLKSERYETFDDVLGKVELTEKGLAVVRNYAPVKFSRHEDDKFLHLRKTAIDVKELVEEYHRSALGYYRKKVRDTVSYLYAYRKKECDVMLFYYHREVNRLKRFLANHAWTIEAFDDGKKEFKEELVKWAEIILGVKNLNEKEREELFELFEREKAFLKTEIARMGYSLEKPCCEAIDKLVLLEEENFITGIANFIEGMFLYETGQFDREEMQTDAGSYEVEVRLALSGSETLERHLDNYIEKAYVLAKEELESVGMVKDVDLIEQVVLKDKVFEWIYN